MSTLEAVLVGIIPSIAVAGLFWYAMRAVVRADRNERAQLARIEREEAKSVAVAKELPEPQ